MSATRDLNQILAQESALGFHYTVSTITDGMVRAAWCHPMIMIIMSNGEPFCHYKPCSTRWPVAVAAESELNGLPVIPQADGLQRELKLKSEA